MKLSLWIVRFNLCTFYEKLSSKFMFKQVSGIIERKIYCISSLICLSLSCDHLIFHTNASSLLICVSIRDLMKISNERQTEKNVGKKRTKSVQKIVHRIFHFWNSHFSLCEQLNRKKNLAFSDRSFLLYALHIFTRFVHTQWNAFSFRAFMGLRIHSSSLFGQTLIWLQRKC